MNLVLIFVAAMLFVILSPGIFVRIPQNGSRNTVLIVHTLIYFAVLYILGDWMKNTISQVSSKVRM
jgi:hypothetical protein